MQIADAGLVKDWMLQVRTSYLPNEILWGYRFEHSCVSYDKQEAKYAVSNNLNKILPDNTPRCSPKDWQIPPRDTTSSVCGEQNNRVSQLCTSKTRTGRYS